MAATPRGRIFFMNRDAIFGRAAGQDDGRMLNFTHVCRNMPGMERPETLLLFDIDGTLVNSGGAGGRAVAAAFEEVYGKPIDLASIDFRGRTDISLWREMLGSHGMDYAPADAALESFKRKYIELLKSMIQKSDPRSTPGTKSLLECIGRKPAVALGLLTGNIEPGGRIKLEAVGLNRFFPVGGFGEDSEDRGEIARAAVRKSEDFYAAKFPPDRIFVIGDAEADVAAARSVGARAVAVATGWTAMEDLTAAGPDFFFEDLRDMDAFLKMIGIQ